MARAKQKKHCHPRGYTGSEVLGEIRRRAFGEYRIPPDESHRVLKEGERHVGMRFRLSALLLGFLKNEGYACTEEELLRIIGCVAGDHADVAVGCMLNPFPKYIGQTLRTNEEIDQMYPGKEYPVER